MKKRLQLKECARLTLLEQFLRFLIQLQLKMSKNYIKLTDASNYADGAILCEKISALKTKELSEDGQYLLAYTFENMILLLDVLDGQKKHIFKDFQNENGWLWLIVVEGGWVP
ncbi:unnamed protein product [Blepharisma stoltei]|uniref:Uncharacterized protein n=1 Tax=Blepharisma stoltei TaxID=1481888 RepID=A0AAU9J397_9CILI|nr:unnamed protein product [Blepharisma stoltei]